MSAKLLVEPDGAGTKITLVGSSGKPLLHSDRFTEPRAKGATMRTLTGLLGDQVTVEDHTTRRAAAMELPATARTTTRRGAAGTGRRTTGRR